VGEGIVIGHRAAGGCDDISTTQKIVRRSIQPRGGYFLEDWRRARLWNKSTQRSCFGNAKAVNRHALSNHSIRCCVSITLSDGLVLARYKR
jgi:hypothetical protein